VSVHVRRPSRVTTYAPDIDSAANWQARGLCRDHDPERWFPVGKTGSHVRTQLVEDVKEICRACPVAETCLNWALDEGITDGVWGAADEAERDEMLRGERPRQVPLPPWGHCRSCGRKRIRPGSTGRNLTCQECREAKASERRLSRLRKATAGPAEPAPTAVVEPPAPVAEGQAISTTQGRLWSRRERDDAKTAIVTATRRVLLASRGEMAS
jgi:WhiB family redox-sensing transcriptional regulator